MDIVSVPPIHSPPRTFTAPAAGSGSGGATGAPSGGGAAGAPAGTPKAPEDPLTDIQKKQLNEQQMVGRDAIELIHASSPETYHHHHRHYLDVIG